MREPGNRMVNMSWSVSYSFFTRLLDTLGMVICMSLIQLILAFVLPPAAVYLSVGTSVHFWINVILTILGWAPGIIHALWVLFLM
jgi:uncharacterized membrane protein YqaE (UPF0057 family)